MAVSVIVDSFDLNLQKKLLDLIRKEFNNKIPILSDPVTGFEKHNSSIATIEKLKEEVKKSLDMVRMSQIPSLKNDPIGDFTPKQSKDLFRNSELT